MAEIILGVGTSHGSQVSLPADRWTEHGELDKKRTNFDQLAEKRGDSVANDLRADVLEAKYERVQAGVSLLRAAIAHHKPDALVIVGDDQRELFHDDGIPSLAVYWGSSIEDRPPKGELAPTHKAALWAMHNEVPEAYPVCAPLGEWIVKDTVRRGFDLTQLSEQPPERSLGHAYTFVRRRLMPEDPIPMVPVFVNTYYPPNQPTVGRCIEFGQALGQAVLTWPVDARIAIVASGGLSHFVVNEKLDREVLDALLCGELDPLRDIPPEMFASGTSEILNWVVAGAALRSAGLQMKLLDYIPAYRSLAGTGCGIAFAEWT